jgi:transposase-like protein
MLAVLWVQFALAVAENKTYGRCQLCNRSFELAPQVNRADRLFCSNNCRVKAYQRRRKQALTMHRQGGSIREIAKATASDLDTVKKWIKGFAAEENSNGQKTKRKR